MPKIITMLLDTGQLFHCIDKRYPGRRLNYKKYYSTIAALGDIDTAIAYGTYMNPGVYDFEQSLQRIGFVTKFVRPRAQGQPFDWAVEIAIQAYESESDIIVLGSSGHEYLPLIHKLSDAEVIIMACGINERMRRAANKTIELYESYLTTKEVTNV